MKLRPGDYVVLNSGGPPMRISARLPGGLLVCVWHALDGPREWNFPTACVTKLKLRLPRGRPGA